MGRVLLFWLGGSGWQVVMFWPLGVGRCVDDEMKCEWELIYLNITEVDVTSMRLRS